MVWKFCCYIDELLGKNVAYDFIDLAALGILGDMMSLRDYETAEIVRQGFAQVRNPFFSEMTKV
jgi:single-stranded DNA-specific DHH superfamily exonuclease